VARRHRIPLVYEVRDLWENALVDRGRFGSESLLYKLARQAESRLLRRADAVVTICDTLRRELEPRVGRTDDVYVVPNGVDVEAFTPRPPSEEVRRRYRLEGKKVLLYVGTFQPYEGLGLLVQAFAQVLARVPQAHLLIAGGSTSLAYQGATTKGTQEELLGGLVSTLGLHGHVTMTGRIPHDEVAGLYTIGDCVIYPRVLTRTTSLTTPLKPLEAMAMGRAVLVSDVPPMKELVREGETGVTFAAGSPTALAERCLELLRDPQRRERLGRAARAYVVSERQWPRLISRYGAVYDSVRGAPERGH
jgi:glycosyltransferase involved in cell wall biosynthesis